MPGSVFRQRPAGRLRRTEMALPETMPRTMEVWLSVRLQSLKFEIEGDILSIDAADN